MRRIGMLSDRREAEVFGDYLLTRQIKAQIDPTGDEWAVWVYDEDRLDDARRELEAFSAEPQADRYQRAVLEADRLRHEEVRQRSQAKKKTVNMADRWRRPLVSQIPVTFALIVVSVVATVGTRFGVERQTLGGVFNMVPRMASDDARTVFPANYRSLPGIRDGEVWRLFSPAFLHFGPFHLLANMYMTVLLGGAVERGRGSWTLIGLFLFTGAIAHLAQLYGSGPTFGGMSGVDFGLFGFMWITGKLDPQSELALPPRFVFIMIAMLLFFMIGIFPIANYAHVGGLMAGMLAAAVNSMWRRWRRA